MADCGALKVRLLTVDKREGDVSKRPTISFSIDDAQLEEIKEYAKLKGFDKPSILARKALFAYMSSNRAGRHDRPRRDVTPSLNGAI